VQLGETDRKSLSFYLWKLGLQVIVL